MGKLELVPLTYSEEEVLDIVKLIRQSLDSDYSLEDFKWKHLENPFGRSFGLLAKDHDKIVAVRLFMWWEFIVLLPNGPKIYRALRPVDTVVHENYRGRGLFKMLTLEGIKIPEKKYDFIFNTPNHNSLPGYLKMGWKRSSKQGVFNYLYISTIFVKKVKFSKIHFSEIDDSEEVDGTNKTKEYLRWRYAKDYEIVKFEDGAILIYKKQNKKSYNLIIVFELLAADLPSKNYLKWIAKIEKTNLIYLNDNYPFDKISNLIKFSRRKAVVVYRNDENNIFNKVHLNLGELEGIL